MNEGDNYSDYSYDAYLMKMRDIEEKQRILKDRVLLIGENLINTKEDVNEKIIGLKKDVEILKETMERIRKFLESVAEEISKFATKDDLMILSKQAKMFQPLEMK